MALERAHIAWVAQHQLGGQHALLQQGLFTVQVSQHLVEQARAG